MNGRRLINFILLLKSYLLSIILRKPVIWGSPSFVSIEPANHCNLKCPECPAGQSFLTRQSGNLSRHDFESFIDQLSSSLSWLTLYFQGEPYLNRDLFDMIAYARKRRVYVWSSTNGHFLSENNIRRTIESGLNRLVISLDGTDQKTYEQYRIGGSYETVVEGIRRFVRIRKEMGSAIPVLEIQFLVLKSNEHQVNEIKTLGKSLGVDRTVLKTAQFYDFEEGNSLMPEGRWSRYKRTSGQERFVIKNPLPNRCFRMWSGCVITWDGKVVPCCFDKDADHPLGDLKRQSFREIWKGEPYRKFRETILKKRKSVDICRNCNQRW